MTLSTLNFRTPAAWREQEADKLAREALHHLRRARGPATSPPRRTARTFANDPRFAAVRDRLDLQAFVSSLDAS